MVFTIYDWCLVFLEEISGTCANVVWSLLKLVHQGINSLWPSDGIKR